MSLAVNVADPMGGAGGAYLASPITVTVVTWPKTTRNANVSGFDTTLWSYSNGVFTYLGGNLVAGTSPASATLAFRRTWGSSDDLVSEDLVFALSGNSGVAL
ncbi:hypothetical protein GCM10025873_25220 [Demequina sediminis]|uniref:hypothetical protein n=1 Tax=Demequina sediminis TaxID=1930058 RepID=UPI0025741962|nr:hypothetical protein [Demequina sediminis]BDZ62731.1 hypothetical protein GCM10025873_25220 [Demequina sediminis]